MSHSPGIAEWVLLAQWNPSFGESQTWALFSPWRGLPFSVWCSGRLNLLGATTRHDVDIITEPVWLHSTQLQEQKRNLEELDCSGSMVVISIGEISLVPLWKVRHWPDFDGHRQMDSWVYGSSYPGSKHVQGLVVILQHRCVPKEYRGSSSLKSGRVWIFGLLGSSPGDSDAHQSLTFPVGNTTLITYLPNLVVCWWVAVLIK